VTSIDRSGPNWFERLAVIVKDHCRERNYKLRYAGQSRGYTAWDIEVPGRDPAVRLQYSAGSYWIKFFGPFACSRIEDDVSPEEAQDAVRFLLKLLDSYADSNTRVISRSRRWRRPHQELHLADGTIVTRYGSRPPPG